MISSSVVTSTFETYAAVTSAPLVIVIIAGHKVRRLPLGHHLSVGSIKRMSHPAVDVLLIAEAASQ